MDLHLVLIDMSQLNFLAVVIVALFVIPIMYLKGARWTKVSEGLNLTITTSQATEALCISQMLGLVLPGSLGDFVRVPYMGCRGNPMDKSILSLFLDAIFASIIPYSIGVLAILIVFEINITIMTIVIPVLWFVGSILVYLLIKHTIWPWFLSARLEHLLSSGISGNMFLNLPSTLKSVGKKRIIVVILIAAMAWITYSVQAFILAIAFGIEISWSYLTIALGLSTMLTAIPITIHGLGIREGVLLYMLGQVGITSTAVMAFSLSLMLVSLLPSIVGLVSFARDPFIGIEEVVSLQDDYSNEFEIE